MITFELFATWLGYGVMGAGGLLLMCTLLIAGIGGVNTLGRDMWKSLRALHEINEIRRYAAEVRASGKPQHVKPVGDWLGDGEGRSDD